MKHLAIGISTALVSLISQPSFSAPAADTTKSIIWEISGNGMTAPSYLFGIVHLICPEDYVWTGVMRDCFQKSKTLCFAEHVKESTGMSDNKVLDSTGKSIRDYFNAKDYDDVRNFFQSRAGINIDAKQNNHISTMIAWLIKADLGCSDPVSYETRLSKLANVDHKPIKIMDDMVEEAGDLEEMPVDKIVSRAIGRAHGDSAARKELRAVINAFKNQDQAQLRDMLSHLGYYRGETKLDEENSSWMPHFKQMLGGQPVFFVVGAAHLGGDHGLISMLREKGYAVKPLGRTDTASVLDIQPKPTIELAQYTKEHLKIPKKAVKSHLEGTVTIKYLVTETGKIKKCSIAFGFDTKCNKAVLKMVKKMPPYKPGLKHGKPSEFWLLEKFEVHPPTGK